MYFWTLENRKKGLIEFQYDLNLYRFDNEVESIVKVIVSKTLSCFYGIVILIIFAIVTYYKFIA